MIFSADSQHYNKLKFIDMIIYLDFVNLISYYYVDFFINVIEH